VLGVEDEREERVDRPRQPGPGSSPASAGTRVLVVVSGCAATSRAFRVGK
jgi:hypothetical protein